MRHIDAHLAQEIADKELSVEEAGIVQHVLSHTPTAQGVFLTQKDFDKLRTLLDNVDRAFEHFTETLQDQDEFACLLYAAQSLVEEYAAAQRANAPTIYLTLKPDRTWFCSVADTDPSPQHFPLVQEGNYPVELYYSRVDLNGSSVTEMEPCKSRVELAETLNWIGQIGGTVEQLWDFDHNNAMLTGLADIFRSGRERRYEQVQADMADWAEEYDIANLNQLLGQAFATADPDKEYSYGAWSIRFDGFLDGSPGHKFELSYGDIPVVFGNTFSKRLEVINSEGVPLKTLLPAVESGIPGHGFPCQLYIVNPLDIRGNNTREVEGALFEDCLERYVPLNVEDGFGYDTDIYDLNSLSALKDVVMREDNQCYGIESYELSINNTSGFVDVNPTVYALLSQEKEVKPSLDEQVTEAATRAQSGAEVPQKSHEQDDHSL